MDTTINASWAGDDLRFVVNVTNTNDASVKNLTGATVEVKAKKGATTVAGTATLTDAANGVITATFNNGDLTAGTWIIQVRATLSGDTQTVLSASHKVEVSNF